MGTNYSGFPELCKQKEDLKIKYGIPMLTEHKSLLPTWYENFQTFTKVERIVHEHPYVQCLDSTINISPRKTTFRDHVLCTLEKFLWACRAPETTRGRSVLSWAWSRQLLLCNCRWPLIILLFLWESKRERTQSEWFLFLVPVSKARRSFCCCESFHVYLPRLLYFDFSFI